MSAVSSAAAIAGRAAFFAPLILYRAFEFASAAESGICPWCDFPCRSRDLPGQGERPRAGCRGRQRALLRTGSVHASDLSITSAAGRSCRPDAERVPRWTRPHGGGFRRISRAAAAQLGVVSAT